MPLVGLLTAINTGKVAQSRKQYIHFMSVAIMLQQTLFELWNCYFFIVKQWQSKIFELLGSTCIFSASRERNLKNTFIIHLTNFWKCTDVIFTFLLRQRFLNFYLSRCILEKTEIIWHTLNIWIKSLFEFVIFSYPNVKSRQYGLSSQEI